MVFQEASSRKTVSFEEQIMSEEKYPGIFSSQMKAFVIAIVEIFFFCNTPSFEDWGISPGYSPVLAGAYSVMSHV